MRGQTRCCQGPSSTTQWSADAPGHGAWPNPTCSPGRSSIPRGRQLLPLPRPAPRSPAAHQAGWAPGASTWVQTGPAAGTRTRWRASSAAPRLTLCSVPCLGGLRGRPRGGGKRQGEGIDLLPYGCGAYVLVPHRGARATCGMCGLNCSNSLGQEE